MSILAIKGHATRGKEVIKILEMLGGVNKYHRKGNSMSLYYYIGSSTCIYGTNEISPTEYFVFTLEEFLEKFPYKVGDKVTIKERDKVVTITDMSWRNGREIIYETIHNGDCYECFSSEELQPYKEETMESKPNILQQLKEYFDNTPREVIEKEWHEYDKYNKIGPTVNEYLEYVNKSRQPKYPKTYEECCDVLGRTLPINDDVEGYKWELIMNFQRLLVCRDAYWKMAGEQMGLGKPWKPEKAEIVYAIFYDFYNDVIDVSVFNLYDNVVLCFPTEEMRDAFYENFKDLIEKCKKLL